MKQITKDSIDRYVEHGTPTGSFLRAVLANDLMQAMGRADEENLRDLLEICGYIYNEIPGSCHGSYQKVQEWIEEKRIERERGQG